MARFIRQIHVDAWFFNDGSDPIPAWVANEVRDGRIMLEPDHPEGPRMVINATGFDACKLGMWIVRNEHLKLSAWNHELFTRNHVPAEEPTHV